MKDKQIGFSISVSIGIGIGTALYDILRHEFSGLDFYRAAFVSVFTFVVFAIVAPRIKLSRGG